MVSAEIPTGDVTEIRLKGDFLPREGDFTNSFESNCINSR